MRAFVLSLLLYLAGGTSALPATHAVSHTAPSDDIGTLYGYGQNISALPVFACDSEKIHLPPPLK